MLHLTDLQQNGVVALCSAFAFVLILVAFRSATESVNTDKEERFGV